MAQTEEYGVATKSSKCTEKSGVFEFANAISPACLFSCDRSFLDLYADSVVPTENSKCAEESGVFEFTDFRTNSFPCARGSWPDPNFPPVISRVRRLFRASWGASFAVLVSSSSQFFRPPFTL